jgi:hypothetical protein
MVIAVSAQASTIGGPIDRTEVIDRAKNWVSRGLTYSQAAWSTDLDGAHTYRRDCSGLVSMVWHLGSSLVTNEFLARAQNNNGMHVIARDSLLAGDAMVRDSDGYGPDGHMELFSHWVNPNDHSQGAYVYSFNTNGETVRNPYAPSNFGNLGRNSLAELQSYTPIRYNNIRDGGGGSGFVEQSRFADIDGDGRDDLIGISGANNDLTAYRNQGWNAPQVIIGNDRASLVSGFGDASHTAFADIDGDGRDDLIGISGANNDLTAYRNQGWNAPQVFVGNDRKTITSGFGLLTALKFADIDGDGRDDLIATTGVNNDVTAYRNQGWNAPTLLVGNDRASLVSGFGDPTRFKFADIDGDNRDDLVAVSGVNNDLTAYRNQGWNAPQVIIGNDRASLVSGFGDLPPLKFADINGDNRDDLIGVSGASPDFTAYRNQGWNAPQVIVGNDRAHIVSGFPA